MPTVMTTTDLLARCCDNPNQHLCRPSYPHFQAYDRGYGSVGTLVEERISLTDLTATIREDYSIDEWPPHLGAWSLLSAIHSEEEGLQKGLNYWRKLATPLEKNADSWACPDLFELVSNGGGLRERPAMYLGNDPSSEHIWSLFSGLMWACKDAGLSGLGRTFMGDFQNWIEARFPFSRDIPWGRTLYFLSLGSASSSLRLFYEYFDFFRSGDAPDCQSATARTIIATITENHGIPSNSLVEEIGNRIAPI